MNIPPIDIRPALSGVAMAFLLQFAARGAALPTNITCSAGGSPVLLNDGPLQDVFPGFGFRFKIRMADMRDAASPVTLLRKGANSRRGCFFLRIDSPEEGGRLSLFMNTDGRIEPRITSKVALQSGKWHEVAGGWDGRVAYLAVDASTNFVDRAGLGASCFSPLAIGPFDGEMSGLEFSGEATPARSVELEPGLRIVCGATISDSSSAEISLFKKPGEYWLRYERSGERSAEFCFFVNLDGRWEPRATVPMDVVPGKRHEIVAAWDGEMAFLQVDGKPGTARRCGRARSSSAALSLGGAGCKIDELAVFKRPVSEPGIEDVRTEGPMPREGSPLAIVGRCTNHGKTLENCSLFVHVPSGSCASPSAITLGELADGASVPFRFEIGPVAGFSDFVVLSLYSSGRKIQELRRQMPVMPREDPDFSASAWNPPVVATRTFHVDSVHGDDAHDGESVETPWRTFARLKGMRLGPGERVLLKRGSVFREELVVTAHGSKDNWAEIGAYGKGPRPIIRRNRFIDDRCVLVEHPRFLAIRDLVVCDAGKGFDVPSPRHLLVERCLSHHIEGLYMFNSHGIPEWRDRKGAPGGCQGVGCGGGLAVGGLARHVVVRDCEMYQCSAAFRIAGESVWMGRIWCHDNFCPNTSPHPYFTASRAWIVDSVFEAAGWNAAAGAMGLMLADNYGLVIRNCHFLNQVDSGVYDEGGIDLEAGGENIHIDRCTFRNNAGAAIEVLGLDAPQARNVWIGNCRFDRNNHTAGHVPSEIFVWGRIKNPRILCSNGIVEGNGFVLSPGVVFYTNQAERTHADWMLERNTEYSTRRELDAAMPYGDPPLPQTGGEVWTSAATVCLSGKSASAAALSWTQLEGPCTADILNASSGTVSVLLPELGDYRFMLKADDGRLWRSARQAVHRLPSGLTMQKAWTFSGNLDAQGWTFESLGTAREELRESEWTWKSVANPVHHVSGDYFVLAVKNSAKAKVISPEMDERIDGHARLAIRMQNHTSSKTMRVWCLMDDGMEWTSANSACLAVRPFDVHDSTYMVDLPSAGVVKRIRLDFSADGIPATGTCRIDYIALLKGNEKNESDNP